MELYVFREHFFLRVPGEYLSLVQMQNYPGEKLSRVVYQGTSGCCMLKVFGDKLYGKNCPGKNLIRHQDNSTFGRYLFTWDNSQLNLQSTIFFSFINNTTGLLTGQLTEDIFSASFWRIIISGIEQNCSGEKLSRLEFDKSG